MEQNPSTRAGVLSAHVDRAINVDAMRSAGYPATDCRECAGQSGIGYAICRDCLSSLPDGICPAHALDALVR